MSIVEIVLLAAGAIAIVSSFFLPDKGGEKAEIPEEELKRLVEEEIENNRSRIGDMTEESVNYQVEKTERSLDRLTNEKMLALGEYSDNVLNQIGSNHQEVVFLHDMLNRAKNELEDLLNRAERESKEANERADAAYTLAENARKLAEEVMEKAEVTARAAVAAEEKMLDARRLTQEMSPQAAAEIEEQPKEDGFQAKELKELVAAHAAAATEAADTYDTPDTPDVDELLKQLSELPSDEDTHEEDTHDEEGSAIDRFLSDRSGSTSEEELQALLDEAVSAAEQTREPDIPVTDMMKVDPEEEKFFEDTQEQDEEDDEEDDDELSEEEMMEKLLREATAELAHDVSWVSAAGEKKKAEKQQAEPEVQPAKAEEPAEEPMRISVKRKGKPKVSKASQDDDEIEGQMSIPEEFMPGNDTKAVEEKKNTVDLQFGHESGNSSNHNERILEMHRMGRSNMAIAKDLGLGIGEVKLVIDLFDNMA
ncbi:MAG: hypothetical protein IKR23_13585 [Lachnospiraceae bacterium]|nr:hypothetical protein [Lachnospiraceae bacterium]